MAFSEKLENLAYTTNTLIKKISTNEALFLS